MTQRAKSWCNPQRSGDIEEKFFWEEDENKRVYIPEFNMLKSDLKYLNRLAKRKKMSPSACLECMVHRYILKDWEFLVCYTQSGKRRERGTMAPNCKVPRRKYMIHPAILPIGNEIRKDKGISYSVFFERMIGEYRRDFPLCF